MTHTLVSSQSIHHAENVKVQKDTSGPDTVNIRIETTDGGLAEIDVFPDDDETVDDILEVVDE